MTIVRMPALLLALGLGISTLVASPLALAQVGGAGVVEVEGACDPQVAQALMEKYKARQDDLDETKEGLLRVIKDVSEESMEDLASCVDMSWPTMQIQYPTMDQIIRGIAKQAVRQACGVARRYISEYRSRMYNSYYFNTRIPGVPSYGISTYTGGGNMIAPPSNSTTPPPNTGNPNPTGGLYGGGNPPRQ